MISRAERWGLVLSGAACGLSGLLLHVLKDWMTGSDPYAVVGHPWQGAVLKVHLLTTPFLIFSFAVIFARHALFKLSSRRGAAGRSSGLMSIGAFVPLVLTGTLIQVFVDEPWLTLAARAHLVLGILWITLLAGHAALTPSRNQGTGERGERRGGSTRRPASVGPRPIALRFRS